MSHSRSFRSSSLTRSAHEMPLRPKSQRDGRAMGRSSRCDGEWGAAKDQIANWTAGLPCPRTSVRNTAVKPTYRIAGWLFPRGLALIYFIAFGSWWFQCDGLTGEHGIMPVPAFLKAVQSYAQQKGVSAFWNFPTIYWWHFSDAFARGLCLAGCGAALLVALGVLQGPLLLALWFGYLSICTTSDVFMGYQWDALLLEAGFVGVLISPWRLFVGRIKSRAPAPAWWQMLLPQALLFKLMFLSGYVKLASKDPTWWNLTALQFHYESQPIPTWTAWWTHQLPAWVHTACCAVMFLIELGLPLLIPVAIVLGIARPAAARGAQWLKLTSCAGFVALMLLITGTGNYTFFNWLAILLSLTLLDDGCWSWLLRHRADQGDDAPPAARSAWIRGPQIAVVAAVLMLNLLMMQPRAGPVRNAIPAWIDDALDHVARFESVNTYGLFAVMTTERNEIIIEVSDDGIFWKAMEFRWKPGRLDRAPPFVAPHQPRLDWQMWFAALHPGFVPERDMAGGPMTWFGNFLAAILEHRPEVLALMEAPPIPVDSIRSVRARFFRYRFNSSAARATSGEWWSREFVGDYSPTFTRR